MRKKTLVIKATDEVNHVWDVALARRSEIGRTARIAGMPIEKFLRALTRGSLRPKSRCDLEETVGRSLPEGFKVSPCSDRILWSRIERTALFDGMSVERMIWRAVCSWVDGAEADMLVHPKTGRPIGYVPELRGGSKAFQMVLRPAGRRTGRVSTKRGGQ